MIKYHKDTDLIVTLTMDMSNRNVNIINHEIGRAFVPVIKHLLEEKAKGQLRGVVLTSAKKTYLAGGDLEYLYNETSKEAIFNYAESLKHFFRQLESPGIPVAAAMNGSALGSGFELALACHYRVALDNPYARFGNPEVHLGLMPGGGACIRLAWLVGIEKAWQILSQGRRFSPREALEWGVIDAIAKDEDELIEKAKNWVLNHQHHRQLWDTPGGSMIGGDAGSPGVARFLQQATAKMMEQTHGNYPALRAILNTMSEGSMVDFDTALRIESRYFTQVALDKSSRNMTKVHWFDYNNLKEGRNRPRGFGRFKAGTIGIIGAGVAGAALAYLAAKVGIKVYLKDVSKSIAEIGKENSTKLANDDLQRDRLSRKEYQNILNLITPTDRNEDFEHCDLVVECVFENKDIKAKVTREAEQHLHRETFFATNTTALSISELAVSSQRPQQYIGLSLVAPIDSTPIAFIIKGEQTNDETLACCIDFVHQIKKQPIVVRDGRGFYAPRVSASYIAEAILMLHEGIPAPIIENLSLHAGMQRSPLAMADELGLPLLAELLACGKSSPCQASELIQKLIIEYQRKGKFKASGGFYDYPAGSPKRLWNELSLLCPPSLGDQCRSQDIQDRLLFTQALETLRCLHEGIIQSVPEANYGSVYGWGFPAFKGGSIQFIHDYGTEAFIARCQTLQTQYGERFDCTPEMLRLIED